MDKKSDKLIKVSVRDFAQTLPTTGSIDARSNWIYSDPLVGVELHASIQAQREAEEPGYTREVSATHAFSIGKWNLEIGGRIDGVIVHGDDIICEEIKTSYAPGRLLRALAEDPLHPYILQVKTYAYLLYQIRGKVPRCRLLVAHARKDEREILDIDYDATAFEIWAQERFAVIIQSEIERQKFVKSQAKIASLLEFPFAMPRRGQAELIESVDASVRSGKRLMVQAPTGLGKSIGVLFPTLREGMARGSKVIYVTPKNSQHSVAENAAHQWQKRASPKVATVRSLTITARAKICMKEEVNCNPDYCEFARNHYDKVNEHDLLAKLSKKAHIGTEVLRQFAERYEVCPYQLGMQALPRRDLIVADYNYVFSPHANLEITCHGSDLVKAATNLVIDEAHNLYARAMEYYSPGLDLTLLAELRDRAASLSPTDRLKSENLIDQCVDLVRKYKPFAAREYTLTEVDPKPFEDLAASVAEHLAESAEALDSADEASPILQLSWALGAFVDILLLENPAFFCMYEQVSHKSGDVTRERLQIYCSDAGAALRDRFKCFASVTAFSATLKPFDFYAKLSGFDLQSDQALEFVSPFSADHRKIIVIPQISTLYEERHRHFERIAESIEKIVRVRPGNYFVFFPSFDFLRRVGAKITLDGFDLVFQEPGASNHQQREVLRKLASHGTPTVVLAVSGGVFSEGVDLPGDQMIGAIIVGPAIPPYNPVREQFRKYYAERYGDGFNFAYTYPAMAKAVQAAGRVIRSEDDRGVIVLMDRRFLDAEYARCLPEGWYQTTPNDLVSRAILKDLEEFWRAGRHVKESSVSKPDR